MSPEALFHRYVRSELCSELERACVRGEVDFRRVPKLETETCVLLEWSSSDRRDLIVKRMRDAAAYVVGEILLSMIEGVAARLLYDLVSESPREIVLRWKLEPIEREVKLD